MANPEDLGRYRLKRLLGRGARGEVWEAAEGDGKVAVKIMHAADEELALARSDFAREARLLSFLRHPHVVTVHDAGEAAGTSFMVMEMVEGRSLRAVLRGEPPAPSDRLRWIRQIGDGLAAMHKAGVVHRDLKPENVIIRADQSACLVDLGVAKWTKFDLGAEIDPDDPFEPPASPAPHTAYVPPETTEDGTWDELGDQYAWAVIAYEVLTGAPPGKGSPPLSERDDVPARVALAIDKGRSPGRADRWDGIDVALDELVDQTVSKLPEAEAEAAPAPALPSSIPPPAAPAPQAGRRSPLLVVGVGAFVLIVAAVAIMAALR